MPSKNAAYVSYAGKEHFVSNYEVFDYLLLAKKQSYLIKYKKNLRVSPVMDLRGFHLVMVMSLLVQ